MKTTLISKLVASIIAALAVLVSPACNRISPQSDTAATAAKPPIGTSEAPAAPSPNMTAEHFDIASIPVSHASLGEFPYISLPEGYQQIRPTQNKFDRVPFWTGDRLQWVEGRVFVSSIHADNGKDYSPLEVQRNIQSVIEGLGGRQVFSGKLPQSATEQINASGVSVKYVDGLGDIYNQPADVFVIHRPDREIWFHVVGNGAFGNWLIAETRPLEITAKVLPTDELKRSLDTTGRVAIHVQFETDQATLLPDSRPQLEQVVALLNDNQDLRLAINGHTDNTGNASHNLQLSKRRAAAVRDFIVAAKVDEKRLESTGFGDEIPVADNNTQEGRARNRRVELVKL